MCGIAGVVAATGDVVDSATLKRFADSLRHRGPDDVGFYGWYPPGPGRSSRDASSLGDCRVGLVHRRLSILDLSDAAWQPMSSRDGRFHIVYNGEIYNYLELRQELESLGHQFRSQSDTEVLLAALSEWKSEALARLNGMFAFAVFDAQSQSLFLARDPFGIKPLYYARWPGGFAFASELTVLLDLPKVHPKVDPNSVFEYLRFARTDLDGATLFSDIRQLPAGSYMTVDPHSARHSDPVPFWEVDLARTSTLTFEQAAEQLRELFVESVKLHVRSDVPVGAALSGGIDSSAIVMTMRRLLGDDHELRTFGYVAEAPGLSEERWMDLVSKAVGAKAYKVRPGEHDLINNLDELIGLQGEPFVSTSIFAQHQVYKLAREADTKVTLDGQGADELLGGYPTFLAARCASLLRRGKLGEAYALMRHASDTNGMGFRGCLYRAGGLLLPASLHGMARGMVGEEYFPEWMSRDWFLQHEVTPAGPKPSASRDVLREQLHETLTQTSLPALLRYGDRNSMFFSVESRVPFLTPPLVQFVFSLPEHFIIAPDGTSKAVFRRAMRGIVPDRILDRRDKVGFVTPQSQWLSSLSKWVDETLEQVDPSAVPVLNMPRVRQVWDDVLSGRRRFDSAVWRWLNLVRWTEKFCVSYSP